MLKLKGFQHATILVKDLERAKRWYGEFMGLKEIPRPTALRLTGAWYDAGMFQVHLVVHDQADLTPPHWSYAPDDNNVGRRDHHLAFGVQDFEEMKRTLREAGIPFTEGAPGIKQVFCRDSEGNLLEFNYLQG